LKALDIVIPVYNEGRNIVPVLAALRREVKTPFTVLICYDFEADDTLPALKDPAVAGIDIRLVRNSGRGAHAAVMAGFAASRAPWVLVFPADDDFNAGILDAMVEKAEAGCDIVCASRFIPGGCMVGCPWLKAVLVRSAAFLLHRLARLPTRDPTSGFRLFSRRVLDSIFVESHEGFTYSIELLVKCHRLGWKVGEVPAKWYERKAGESRFRILRWIPAYLRWFFYAFATTWLGRGPAAVAFKSPGESVAER
jgi:glycosyltransferase involved in cell wall biosynthesis